MAIIQDLPPELLIRILELSVEPRLSLFPQGETTKTFTRTALVARCWRAPSQSLPSSLFHTKSPHSSWRKYIDALSTSDGQQFGSMKSLALDFGRQYSSALADQLAILKAKGVVLQELSFVLTSSRETVRVLNALLAWLVQGVRRLELDTSTQIDENFTLSTKLLLDTLRIGSLVPELPSFLLPFSSAAPRLTCLELQPWGGGLTPTLKASLCELAPQITDLTIGLPPFFEGRDPTVSSLESLLRACTSVTVLRIVNPRPSDLKQILSFLPNCVALVAIFRFEMVIFYDLTPTHLAEVLDLPCMAQLRRWRMPQMARWWGAMSGGGGRGVASSLSSERDRASRRRTLLH